MNSFFTLFIQHRDSFVLLHCTKNECTTVCSSIHLLFPVFAVTNKAAVNIHIQISVWTYASFFFSKYLQVEWLGHMVGVGLIFKKLSSCFPKWLYRFTTLPAVCKSSGSITPLPTLERVHLFNFRHYDRRVMITHCHFNWHFSNA